MSKILRMSDRIHLKIDDVTFELAPLSFSRKQELASCTRIVKGEEHYDLLRAQFLYIKYSLKKISGVFDYDGTEYTLSFEGDSVTDECVSEIMNLDQRNKLTVSAWQILNGIKDLEDPVTGEKLDGVELKVVSQGK